MKGSLEQRQFQMQQRELEAKAVEAERDRQLQVELAHIKAASDARMQAQQAEHQRQITILNVLTVDLVTLQRKLGEMEGQRDKLFARKEELKKKGWLLGGEGSGHLLALDKHTTGDGLISALQVLQACVGSGQTMAQLLSQVTLFPQTLINVRLKPGFDWQGHQPLWDATKTAESELGDSGRVLIRASGTEPLVRVMVEARDPAVARQCAERIAATLAQ